MMNQFVNPVNQPFYPIANREVGGKTSYLQEEEEIISVFQQRVEVLSPQGYTHI